MSIDPNEFLWLFGSYMWDFRFIFVFICAGTFALAAALYCAEGAPPSGAVVTPRAVAEGKGTSFADEKRSSVAANPPGTRAAGVSRATRDLQDVKHELEQVSQALSRLDQDVSEQHDAESERLKAVDDELRSITAYWRQVDESRRVTLAGALYYTFAAMLGLGDFGARTGWGKVVVALAGFWGVLVFGLIVALLVAAAMRQYKTKLRE